MRHNDMPRDHEMQEECSGPLMTNHLKNLDKELELLRRKREAIRQEQELLSMDMDMEYENKRMYQRSRFDFSHLYGNIGPYQPPTDDGPTPFNKPYVFQGPRLKPWQSQLRPSIPSLLSKNIRMPLPHHSSSSHGMNKNKFKKPSFKPQRHYGIVKVPKTNPVAPNKLNSYPIEERKNLVSKAIEKDKPPVNNDKSLILREEEIPTQQMTGRLELALGCIVKEIKAANASNKVFNSCLTNAAYQRILKQVVRERIRSVMLNQVVGQVDDIVQKYRAKFPKETDQDIVDIVIASEPPKSSVAIVQTEDPEEFFKTNVNALLEKKLEDIFTCIFKIYSNSNRKASLCYAKLDENDEQPAQVPTKEKILPHAKHATEIIEKIIGKPLLIEEKNVLSKYYKEILQSYLDENLPILLPKYAKQIMKILDIDSEYKSIKSATVRKIKEQERGYSFKVGQHTGNKEQFKNYKQNGDNNQKTQKEDVDQEKNTTNDESMNVDATSEEKQPVAGGVDNKADPPATPAQSKTAAPNVPATPFTPMGKETPYFIKLIGRPNLPSRAVIYDFLNDFSPASIKKHKSINNLLVIGFTNQENYEKILTADGTVLGNITIIIKASERVNTAKDNDCNKSIDENNSKKDSDCSKEEVKAMEKIEKQEVPANPNIDKQVENLLSAARNEVEGNLVNLNSDSDSVKMETDVEDAESLSQDSTDVIEVKKEKPQVIGVIKEEDENDDNKSNTDSQNSNTNSHDGSESKQSAQAGDVDKGPVSTIKEAESSGRATPTRSSSRLTNVTPSSIRTRRASRLMQN